VSKEIRHPLVLLGIAACFLGGAVWQGQVASARELAQRQHTLPAPAKTKHAVRPAPVLFSGDSVADYVAHCEKGMTDQEILWIPENLKKADLKDGRFPSSSQNADHFPAFFAQRAARHRWYRAC
jgi:hypothetical protein